MSFAQKILEKYGWKDGDGLGKNNDGITKPLKASLKFDNAGIGVDRADEFNNHWWERVFNEAAKNVEIKKDGDKVSVNRKNDESIEITTKEYSVRKLKKKKLDKYDNFLSTATLVNTGDEVANPFKIEVDEIKVTPHKPLTDEELFAACGGRTAHKGARHGLKLSGKLARIEQQEKEMLLKMQTNNTTEEKTPESWTVVKSKKKNKRKSEEEKEPPATEEVDEESKLNDTLFITEYCIKSKKKRKEQKQTEEELSNSLGSFNLEKESAEEQESTIALVENEDIVKKHKKEKKSKKNKDRDSNKTTLIPIEDTAIASIENCEEAQEEFASVPLKKKNKKCKHGIDKDAKKAHKKAKKMKKNLRHITEDSQRSIVIEA
ncbi:G patch domain-containing protein 4 [Eupeodes corollae]|uniref:G patch domain-containing protein 4 n=1 Tax=Eupeodes corollae TaxID=290404 RepID=UPI00249109F9|nr:G patch domain-containing protein 4 [Eupeodes corollae]